MIAPNDRRTSAFVGVAAAAVSLIGSWRVSLWTDEAATISGATRSLSQLWRLVQNVDAVHGFYYLFMHFWIAIFGSSAFSIRLPSAIAVGVATVGVLVLGRELIGVRVGLWAAVVFAVLPRTTWMGLEARSSAFSTALAVWATVLLVLALRRENGTARLWIGYAVLLFVGIATNIYVVLLLPAHLLGVLLAPAVGNRARLNRARLNWAAATGIALVAAAPVVLESQRQGAQLGQVQLGLVQMARSVFLNQWFLGATPDLVAHPSGLLGGSGTAWKLSSIGLALLAWALMLFALWCARSPRSQAPARTIVPWLVTWAAVPPLVIVAYSLLITPIYHPRYFAFVAPAIALLVAIGLVAIERNAVRVGVFVVLVVLALPVYLSQREVYAKNGTDWVDAAAFVQAHQLPGQGVYYVPLTPPTSPEIVKNLRLIASAYPKAFAGLRDVTLRSAGPADGSLYGTSGILADSTVRLESVTGVWVIRLADYPAEDVAKDDQTLQQAGFRADRHWAGPLDDVTLYVRSTN